jgi:hypothetical protein
MLRLFDACSEARVHEPARAYGVQLIFYFQLRELLYIQPTFTRARRSVKRYASVLLFGIVLFFNWSSAAVRIAASAPTGLQSLTMSLK